METEAILLTTIPGIGFSSALLIYAEIGDIKRFPNSKNLCKLCRISSLTKAIWKQSD
ncbi:MAG: transposase [Archaeoglobus sp.]|nr:transposase [Archaeoglobus sp.]